MELTQEKIDKLIARREKLTNRRDGRINIPAVNEIDAQLAQVPPGVNNDVDLLLGRRCAKLPERVEYKTQNTQHMHQCGWCGEWYIDARVDHGCPPPQSAMEQDYINSFNELQRWSTDEQRAEWKDNGAEKTAWAAQSKQDEFLMYIADQTEDYLDFNQIRGDLAL